MNHLDWVLLPATPPKPARKLISDYEVCLAFEMCRWARRVWELADMYPDVYLFLHTGQPEKVVYAAMERAYHRGLLEHGVSMRTSWLRPKGLDLLGLTRDTQRTAQALTPNPAGI